MSDLIKDSPNYPLWEKVFEQVREKSQRSVMLDGDAEVLRDVAGGDYPDLSICGTFRQNGAITVITFEYNASWDEISELKFV